MVELFNLLEDFSTLTTKALEAYLPFHAEGLIACRFVKTNDSKGVDSFNQIELMVISLVAAGKLSIIISHLFTGLND